MQCSPIDHWHKCAFPNRHFPDGFALQKARDGRSYVVTSGTGSGKSLTYFLPIIDSLIRQTHPADRTAAA